MIEYDTFLAPHDGSCRFCQEPIKEGQRVKYYGWSWWYHAACVDAHRARQARAAADREDDALSVLRDLVALRDSPILPLNSARRPIRAEAFEAAWARARALVADHTTDEETP